MKETSAQSALMQMITSKWVSQAIYVAAKLGVADHLRVPKSAEELARAVKVDSRSLYRVLRALSSVGIFKENKEGRFELTPMGSCLQSNVPGSLRAMALFFGEDFHWKPWIEVMHSVKTGRSAFDHVHKTKAFEYFEKNPEAGALFNEAMTSLSTQESNAVASAYDFSGHRCIVDVAGGHGLFLATVLKAFGKANGILFDLPHVVDGAKKSIEAAGLARQCELARGDFFKAVPEGGDAYTLKHIIHDWDDDAAISILKNCRKAMSKKGKLLVVETVIPPGNDPHLGKLMDLEMLVMTPGGRERTEAEYRDLYRKAGFKLTRVVPTPSPVSVVEGVPA